MTNAPSAEACFAENAAAALAARRGEERGVLP